MHDGQQERIRFATARHGTREQILAFQPRGDGIGLNGRRANKPEVFEPALQVWMEREIGERRRGAHDVVLRVKSIMLEREERSPFVRENGSAGVGVITAVNRSLTHVHGSCYDGCMTRHVYHLNRVRLWAAPTLWLIGVAAIAWLQWGSSSNADTTNVSGALILLSILTVMVAPFAAIMWQSRLVLTNDGIAHHQFGYTVSSSWINLEALDLTPGRQSLYLAKPGTQSRLLSGSTRVLTMVAPGIANGLVGNPEALALGQLIPLTPFLAHWENGALRSDLERWAPHLFTTAPHSP